MSRDACSFVVLGVIAASVAKNPAQRQFFPRPIVAILWHFAPSGLFSHLRLSPRISGIVKLSFIINQLNDF